MEAIRRSAVLIAVLALALVQVAIAGAAGAVRPRTTPLIGRQLAELEGSSSVGSNGFGVAVAISGRTAVVGACNESSDLPSAAYVFIKTASGWNQVAELKGSDSVGGDGFGSSVAVSGTTVVVGASWHANYAGRAYVFTKTATGWAQVAELKGSDTIGTNGFGDSVAISGTTILVGASDHDNYAGRAYVFTKTASGWKETAELKGSDTTAGDYFGAFAAMSGTTTVVGAPYRAGKAGRAYIFTKTASGWKETAELKSSDTVAGDQFGSSVAISGTRVVVGAIYP